MAQGRVNVDIIADDKDLQNALNRSASSIRKWGKDIGGLFDSVNEELSNFSKKVDELEDISFSGAAFEQWTSFITEAIELGKILFEYWAEQARAETRLENVLYATGNAAGFTADQLIEYAGALQNVTSVADDVIIGVEATLSRFTNIRGDVFQDAILASIDLSKAWDKDLQSAAKALGVALEQPEYGMRRLRQEGIKLRESQEELIKELIRTGDVAGAQRVILNEVAVSSADAGERSGQKLLGQIDLLKNRLGDLAETVLAPFIPLIDDVTRTASFFIERLTFGLQTIGPIFEYAIIIPLEVLKGSFYALLEVVAATLSSIIAIVVNWQTELSLAFNLVTGNLEGVKSDFEQLASSFDEINKAFKSAYLEDVGINRTALDRLKADKEALERPFRLDIEEGDKASKSDAGQTVALEKLADDITEAAFKQGTENETERLINTMEGVRGSVDTLPDRIAQTPDKAQELQAKMVDSIDRLVSILSPVPTELSESNTTLLRISENISPIVS